MAEGWLLGLGCASPGVFCSADARWWMAARAGGDGSTWVTRGKDKSAQSKIVNTRMPEPASFKNIAARRHIIDKVPVKLGRRYGGSSKISGMRRPLTAVRPSTPAEIRVMNVENKYIAIISSPCTGSQPNRREGGNNAPMISVYTGKRAEQVISGTTSIVSNRSRWRSIVRVAKIAGTAQAKPESMGTNARPCRPSDFMMRSIKNATRAM